MRDCMLFDAEKLLQENFGVVAPKGIHNSDAVFAFYASTLSFPEYFGWNWDAFHDCITDLSWFDAAIIHVVHPDVPLVNDSRACIQLLCELHELKFYSRINGKLVVHFMSSDRKKIQEALFCHYRVLEHCNSNSYLEYYRDKKRWNDDAGGALKVIDKGLAIGYAELGLLDPMEIEGTSHGGIEYRS